MSDVWWLVVTYERMHQGLFGGHAVSVSGPPLRLFWALRRQLLSTVELALLSLPLLWTRGNQQRSCCCDTGMWCCSAFGLTCLPWGIWNSSKTCFFSKCEQLLSRWNETLVRSVHVRHFPVAAGSVQETLTTAALGDYFFFLPACPKPPQFQWDLRGLGTSSYWEFCCVK